MCSQTPGSFLDALHLEEPLAYEGVSRHMAGHGAEQPYLWFDQTVWLYPEEYTFSERMQKFWSSLQSPVGPASVMVRTPTPMLN